MTIAKVRLSHHIYPKERIAEAAPLKLLILLLCEWDLVQAKFISLQFPLSEKHMDRKDSGIVTVIHMQDFACNHGNGSTMSALTMVKRSVYNRFIT
jgi:hypothetical protein